MGNGASGYRLHVGGGGTAEAEEDMRARVATLLAQSRFWPAGWRWVNVCSRLNGYWAFVVADDSFLGSYPGAQRLPASARRQALRGDASCVPPGEFLEMLETASRKRRRDVGGEGNGSAKRARTSAGAHTGAHTGAAAPSERSRRKRRQVDDEGGEARPSRRARFE